MKKPYWKRGELTELSYRSNISIQYISDIVHRRRGVSLKRAQSLSFVASTYLGRDISVRAWLECKSTKHPAFFGKPKGRPIL